MKTVIKVLRAFHGDCIIVETTDIHNNQFIILIDGGTSSTYKTALSHELKNYRKIDLMILTHIDDDHIGGILMFLKSEQASKIIIDKIIVNAPNLLSISQGTQISYRQGEKFEKFIFSKYPNIKIYKGVALDKNFDLPLGIDLTILSPTKGIMDKLFEEWSVIDLSVRNNTKISSIQIEKAKDFNLNLIDLAMQKDENKAINNDIFNASSLAFILKITDKNLLFLGDSHSNIVYNSLKSLNFDSNSNMKFDYVKLSHHGSEYNVSEELLNMISCYNFIISTNGGRGNTKHPNRKTIAKIVCNSFRSKEKVNFFFNYNLNEIQAQTGKLLQDNEEQQFNFKFIEKNILE
jgi:beta-lactamase superfamily II metal-dependent hydrolase